MQKKRVVGTIVASVLLGWLFNIFPGRLLLAKISTWPVLNQWKILSPQAPIVITNRETVRVSDGSDVLQAANLVKSKISAIVQVKGAGAAVLGGAVNLTSDGSFVSAASVFSGKTDNCFVVLSDGRQAQVSQKVFDPATGLVFFKAALGGVPAASLGNSKDLQPGYKVIFVQNSLLNFSNKISVGWVNFSQAEIEGQILQSDYPRRAFGAQAGSVLASGQAVVNTNGDVVGIWSGSGIISSDVIKQAVALYFNNQQAVSRPEFGFGYQLITQNDSKLTGQTEGAKVTDVSPVSAARQAGLFTGDIVTAIGGQKVNENSQLEEILQKYKPGDKLTLDIARKNQSLVLSLTAGELK